VRSRESRKGSSGAAKRARNRTAERVYRPLAVKDVHIVIGCLALGLNLGAFVLGAAAWFRRAPSPWFWKLLRGGQAMVVVEAALGGILLLMGHKVSNLHLLYGLLPLVVSVFGEQLKISAATQILDNRGLDDARAVGGLPAADQREIVVAIMRREIGAMTLSALVVTALLARAATVIH
jgi:hypothetical protein